jgi:catechol 2,3-dioxygenase-like lactoylglutathione lyase family enzyme
MDLGWFEAALNVTDLARSRAFYETLGFECAGGVGQDVAAMYKDDCSVTLYQRGLDPERPNLIFWQGDVEAIARDLEARGVSFHRPFRKDDAGGAGFILCDPDGHPLHVITMKKYADNSPGTGPDGKRIKARQYPPNKMRGIDFGRFEISLPVKEMQKSVAFYRMLGFRIVEDHDPRNVTLVSNDCRLSLYEGYLDPDRPQLIFWQGDLRAIGAHLTAKGLIFLRGPASDERGTGAMLIDPGGHPLYFVNIHRLAHKEPA